MKLITVRGGKKLYGKVDVSGMKNSALPIIFSTILAKDKCIIENVPNVSDISLSFDILRLLGAKVTYYQTTGVAVIDTAPLDKNFATYDIVSKMRGSTYLIGALLARFGSSHVGWPGGCDFGSRPIDQHIKGFEMLGAKVSFKEGYIDAVAPNGLVGGSVYFDMPSVGATVNVMITASLAKGETIIDNAAREPHIVDLANFLNMCGADITGAGTSTIKIRGVEALHGCTYAIVPDMIEAGTYMVAAGAVGGEVTVNRIIPKHMETVTAKLTEAGVDVEVRDTEIVVRSDGSFRGVSLRTLPYPGFPTDMQPQFGAFMCLAEGVSNITEGIFDSRFRYLEEIKKMGGVSEVVKNKAIITGQSKLVGTKVHSTDLRAGAALLIAAMAAEGETEISGVELIERGYFDIVGKLRSLGADVELIEV